MFVRITKKYGEICCYRFVYNAITLFYQVFLGSRKLVLINQKAPNCFPAQCLEHIFISYCHLIAEMIGSHWFNCPCLFTLLRLLSNIAFNQPLMLRSFVIPVMAVSVSSEPSFIRNNLMGCIIEYLVR